jgi:hypothetical protein
MPEHSDTGRLGERPGERQYTGERASDAGLTGWLRRAISPRPREVWVMEPDGRMRKVAERDA